MLFDTNKLLKFLGIGLLAWISGSLMLAARADAGTQAIQPGAKILISRI